MEITTTVENSKAVFKVDGKLTVLTSPELEAAIGNVSTDICDFDIDLADVSYISSAGLRVLVAADKLAVQRGGTLRLLKPVPDVMEVFDMTGLAAVLTIES